MDLVQKKLNDVFTSYPSNQVILTNCVKASETSSEIISGIPRLIGDDISSLVENFKDGNLYGLVVCYSPVKILKGVSS